MDGNPGGARGPASFGALLRRFRVRAGLSQEALAERARLSARAISAYERGLRQAPYRGTFDQLARTLDLSAKERAALEATIERRRGPRRAPFPADGGTTSRVRGRTNLPAQLTSFIGRQCEIAEVTRLLARSRLLTLTGTGGCGKTRLALEVVGSLAPGYPDGVWLVDLAPLADPIHVPRAVADAAGVRDEPGQPLLETLLATLGSRQLLLVLDNCEHLLDACAVLATTLLHACPHLRILATSRQALGVAGGMSWRVPSLPVPPDGAKVSDPSPHLASSVRTSAPDEYAAVQLFVERAQGTRPGFALTGRNREAVAEICRRLDGIPLAIELAAARVRVLSVEQIARRLDDRFRLLVGGSRGALPRQQTLLATLDWSYGLLAEPERALFRRLSVFVGSFDVDAVEAVGDGSALDLLTELVDKSLVLVEENDGEARYRLLETVRQYGREKLVDAGEAEVARRRHRDWYRALVERAAPELTGLRQREWLDRLECEHDNVRAVLEGSAGTASDEEEGLRMAAALGRFWIVRGYLGEGQHLLAPLLQAAASTPTLVGTAARMWALRAGAMVAYWQGDYALMEALAEEWLVVAQEVGDEVGLWLAHDMLARVAMNRGDYPRARPIFEGELTAMRRLEDAYGICSGLVGLGVLARLQGDDERAVACCEECLAVSRVSGDVWFIGQALSNLGLAHYQQGQYGVAKKLFGEALAVRRELADQSGVAWSLINLGDVEQAEGNYPAARTRLEESLAILRDLGDRSGRADALASLGRVARAEGDFASAHAYYVESLVLRRDLGHWLAMPAMLEDLASLAIGEGDNARALTLAGAGTSQRALLGAPASSVDAERIASLIGMARPALDEDVSCAAWARGQTMTLAEAIAYALGRRDRGTADLAPTACPTLRANID